VEVFRNAVAERFRNARHADAVVEATMIRLLDRACGGEACEEECSFRSAAGGAAAAGASPLRERAADRAAVFVHDISEIHRVESVRRDFVANVSHELKTPIGAVGLLAETLASSRTPE